ncbi:uncharacterized protein LOC663235 [Tribolium castaneum]|uniref:CHK kinase-like domain-containing protein n=1 Tax=Tribolium castaneum TaxID=7070 RepID=D6WTH6_TRICA|nr:PREDICTED: uncharacterized protein LOC663235 [Tribolium castaneum]EFA06293.1 hypothetical protein TcasGA2_TC009160 [Tribolium castaneum]|eukprot:XP_008195476.1 PREDICTED: uncharacterized protein LOC663235 [Tribolium castaneum]
MSTQIESEVKQWLATAFKLNLSNFSVKLVGSSGKGDGYVGDILFAQLSTPDQVHNLVLKCNKRSKTLQQYQTFTRIFLHEMFLYETLLPTFIDFQKEKNLAEIFDSVPKFYGSYKSESAHVIVLEDLKKLGFELWPVTKPLNREHIEVVVREYGKFHATSVALKTLKPEKFQEILTSLGRSLSHIFQSPVMQSIVTKCVQKGIELLEGEVEEKIIAKLKHLRENIANITVEFEEKAPLKVVCHGDCWNNNFMYKYNDNSRNVPSKVAIIDWQIASYGTPISDLSYFLFSCISAKDIERMEDILLVYHQSFSSHLEKFGLIPENLYPRAQFLNDWKNCSKFGFVMAHMATRASYVEKDDIVDLGEALDKGMNLADYFSGQIGNVEGYKKRITYLAKYAYDNNLL